MSGYQCATCGAYHAELPLAYAAELPHACAALAPAELAARTELTPDWCVADGRWYFVRGQLEIPVVDTGERFAWGVWVSVSEASFARIRARWDVAGREAEPSAFGWLNTALPLYPDTLNLKTQLHTRPVGERPLVELEPTDHPLAVEQRRGITRARVAEIASALLHGRGDA